MNQNYGEINRERYSKRRAVNKRDLFLGSIALCVVIILSVLFISRTVEAQGSVGKTKIVASIQIEKGDTLWDIAKEYMTDEYDTVTDYVEEIKASNGLVSDTIHAGNYIIVPYYADASK